MKTILITGIGGPTPRSIASIIRKRYPDYKLVGIDINIKALGFYMKGLLDYALVSPKANDKQYWPFIEKVVKEFNIDYAIVQPEKEIIAWGEYFQSNGKYLCPTFLPCKRLASSLMDKAIMADILDGTEYIPKTIKVTQSNPRYDDVKSKIGFPCWIRATQGSGGLGSLKITNIENYKSWLFINKEIQEFTVSEFLSGRHLANQMLYYNDEYIKGASLECAEYVMGNLVPSKVTGTTAFGRFLNEDRINEFCDKCIKYITSKLDVKAHGVLSFDLKEDKEGNMKVTEVNIRHMAYTGIMAEVGFDLISDTISIIEVGDSSKVKRAPYYHYDKPYIFLRDVDIEPIILRSEEVFNDILTKR